MKVSLCIKYIKFPSMIMYLKFITIFAVRIWRDTLYLQIKMPVMGKTKKEEETRQSKHVEIWQSFVVSRKNKEIGIIQIFLDSYEQKGSTTFSDHCPRMSCMGILQMIENQIVLPFSQSWKSLL